MLKTVLNKKNLLIILCILLVFLMIPSSFAQDSSLLDDSLSSNGNDLANLAIDHADGGVVNNSNYQDTLNMATEDNACAADKGDISDDLSEDIGSYDLKDNLDSNKKLASGKIIYVSPDGTDSAAGEGLIDNPYRTPQKALSESVDGDTIFLFNGVYTCSNMLIKTNVTIIGESQDGVILDGENLNRICEINATDVNLYNLTFRNGFANKSNEENGGAISSKVSGYLNIINCTFVNNRGATHGGAISVFENYRTPEDKRGDIHFYVENCTFLNNTAVKMYGGAIHVTETAFYGNVYADIRSSIFIDNTGGREQEHSIAVSASESTYFDIHDCVIFADSEKIISSTGAYKALVYYKQHSSRGIGYANADGNWWGDNANPADFNRTSNIDVNNWVVMSASASKGYIIATLDRLKNIDNQYLDYDASKLPIRTAVYSPSSFFPSGSLELIDGVAKNKFSGELPQDILVRIDNQNLTVRIESLGESSWFIGNVGYVTLKEAVAAANDGDVIKGVPDIYSPDPISEDIIIDKDLTISKLDNMTGDYILLSSKSSRIFNVSEGKSLTLENLILDSGDAVNGGLIYLNSGSSVTIDSSIFRKAKGLNGGAIYSDGGNIKINNTQFEDISSSNDGGAIYIRNGDLEIYNSKFSEVESLSEGGVIYQGSGERLFIDNSTFISCHAQSSGVAYSNADSIRVNNSVFLENYADNNYRILYAERNLGIENSIFANNDEFEGFDVYVNDPISSNLNKNYWGQNEKVNSSRTNVNIDNWVILKMDMDENLSLISVNSKHNLTISFNEYTDGVENHTLENPMPNFTFELNALMGSLSSTEITFDSLNTEQTVIYTAASSLGDEVISIDKYSDQNISFYIRTTVYHYWFINDIGYETLDDAIEAASNGDVIVGQRYAHLYDSTVEINKNLTIKSNYSTARVTLNGELLEDGPIFHIADGAIVNLVDLIFTGAKDGAILNDGVLTLINSSFTRNNGEDGAAIYNDGDLKVIESNFTNNNAINGGAIYNNKTLNLVESIFSNNAANNGGAIYNRQTAVLDKNSFTYNKASLNGGAIASSKGLDIRNSYLLRNNASMGGAIYSNGEDFDDDLVVKYCVFDGNNGSTGMNIAAYNFAVDNSFQGSMDYSNLIYNISSKDYVEPYTDFKYLISGPSDVGFGQTVEFTIELYSINGDVSLLPDYNVSISSLIGNRLNADSLNINEGPFTLIYQASQNTGDDAISISDLSGLLALHEFTVGSVLTHFEFENMTVYYNQNETLVIYLKDESDNILAGFDVKVNFNGEEINQTTDSGGKVLIDLSDLEIDTYEGNIRFEGADKYIQSSALFKVEVSPIPTKINVDDMTTYYSNGSALDIEFTDVDNNPMSGEVLNILVKDQNGNEVYNEDLATDNLGKISLDIDYLPGNYTVEISYEKDGIYNKSSKSISLNVEKMPTIIVADDMEISYNSNESMVIIVTDSNGVPIDNIEVSILILDNDSQVISTIKKTTSDGGKVTIDIDFDIGDYTVEIGFEGNENYICSEKSVKLNVIKMPTAITFNTVIIHAKEDVYLTAVLSDSYGNVMSGKDIDLKLVEESTLIESEYSLKTNDEGLVSQLVSLNKGAYKISYVYAGDDLYGGSELNLTLNVLDSINPYIESEDTIIEDGEGSIVAYLKEANGNPIIGENVLFEIGDNVYNNLTDSQGKVQLYPQLESGNYTVVISFTNDDIGTATKTIALSVISSNETVPTNDTNDTNDTRGIKTAKDLQELIDNAADGSVVDLGNNDYVNVSNVNITKNITISGKNASISSDGSGNPIFVIPSISSGGPESVNVTDFEYKANNGDILVLANADNGTSPSSLDVAEININGITVSEDKGDLVGESVVILELNSQRSALSPNRPLKVQNNTLISGISPFKFNVTDIKSGSDAVVDIGGNIPDKTGTKFIFSNMSTYAIDYTLDGRIGPYFNIKLVDENGNALANKAVQFGFNGKIYNKTTNATGEARLQINLGAQGGYTFALCFLGDENYNASFAVAKITVDYQKAKLTTAKKTYKATAKTKTLTATFKTIKGNPIKGKTITFTVNGKTYTAKTNAKGVATVKVSLSAKKTYSFTAKYAGDKKYAATSVKSTVVIS